jgi:hypothetical protein
VSLGWTRGTIPEPFSGSPDPSRAERRPLPLEGDAGTDIREAQVTGKPLGGFRVSGHSVKQLFRPRLELEPSILMWFVARNRRNPLHEVEDTLGLAALLGEHRLDDLGCLRLAEPAIAQEFGSFVVGRAMIRSRAGFNTIDEGHRR